MRLIAAVVLGGAIGLERELRHKAAGLRTNALIAVGAAAFTIVGLQLTGTGGDPSRIASTIVTGIGFLGAGAILRTAGGVHGLTTAATIWVNAAIGMAAGSGAIAFATVLTAIVLAVLWIVGLIERRVEQRLDNLHRDQPGPSA